MTNYEINEAVLKQYVNKFSTREEYLTWVAAWKWEYKNLTKAIRETKSARKQFVWAYRPKGDDSSPKRAKIGTNPSHNSNAAAAARFMRAKANEMLEERRIAKYAARVMKQRAKQERESEYTVSV